MSEMCHAAITDLMKGFYKVVDSNFNVDALSSGLDEYGNEFLEITISDDKSEFYEIKIAPCEPI